MPIPVRIHVQHAELEKPFLELIFSEQLGKELQLSPRFYCTLEYGREQISCHGLIGNVTTPIIKATPGTANLLHLYDGQQLHLQILPRRRIRLGPILGIILSHHFPQQPERPFGYLTSFCTEVTIAAHQRFIETIIFTPKQLLASNGREMEAFVYRQGAWTKSNTPLPHLIYNRLASRLYEQSEEYERLKELLKQQNIPMFNENFLNKWQIHETLYREPELQRHIPFTIMYRGKSTLLQMLKQFPTLYLKPIHGSMGRGIYRVQRLARAKNPYRLQHMTLHGLQQRSYPNFQRLLDSLRLRIKRRPYLIQQGVPLMKQHGSTIDFRALVQKDGEENWSITSLVARFGQSNSFVSNIARGGYALSAQQALQTIQGWKGRPPTTQQLRRMALHVAQVFDQHTPGNFAELGIDLGVDIYGKIWLLEVNSKPSKTDDTLLEDTPLIRPSVKKMLHYVLHQTKFIKEAPRIQRVPRKILNRRKRLGR